MKVCFKDPVQSNRCGVGLKLSLVNDTGTFSCPGRICGTHDMCNDDTSGRGGGGSDGGNGDGGDGKDNSGERIYSMEGSITITFSYIIVGIWLQFSVLGNL